MNVLCLLSKNKNMELKRRGRRKKIHIPSEREYYAAFETWYPEKPELSEKARESMRFMKKNPPPYELIKKIYDRINASNGYR